MKNRNGLVLLLLSLGLQVEPNRSLVDRMTELESHPGVLSVSFAHGFPFGDTPDTGAKVIVVADNAPATGQKTAEDLRGRIWSDRFNSSPA